MEKNKNENLINQLSLNQLLCLSANGKFYSVVNSSDMLKVYCNALHKAWCTEKNIEPAVVEFVEEEKGSNWAFLETDDDKAVIKIVSFFIDYYNISANCTTSKHHTFPILLVKTCLHESKHVWQLKNIPNLKTNKFGLKENLNVAAFMLSKKEREGIKNYINNPGYSYFQYGIGGDLLFNNAISEREYDYEKRFFNAPHEFDAHEEVLTNLQKIYSNTHSQEVFNFKAKQREGLILSFFVKVNAKIITILKQI